MGPRLDRRRVGAVFAVCAALGVALPAAAAAAPVSLTSYQSPFAGITVSVHDGDRHEILDRVRLQGRIAFPGPRESATITIRREGRLVQRRKVSTDPSTGRYHLWLRLKGCCGYTAQAEHRENVAYPVAFRVHAPKTLEDGRHALLFNRLLRRAGYHMGEEITDEVGEDTGLAVMAMRKVHGLERTEEYDPRLFTTLLRGGGRFQPAHDEPGRHVEVDVERQVMALVEDGVATDVFHVSTGAGGTPSGEWTFYSKTPGYNAKGMYYSAFYDGNYATHGYYTVPTYPASHGCTRNPEAYSVFIYDWIELGDRIYVYA